MGKTKKEKNSTVYVCYEGDREELFLKLLKDLYQPKKNHINIKLDHTSGGTPDRIVGLALKNNDRDKVFAWFDEDFEPDTPLSEEIKEGLARCWCIQENDKENFFNCPLGKLQSFHNPEKRKPVLIVSQPVCVKALILKALGRNLPCEIYDHLNRDKQINQLKNALKNLIGKKDEDQFYKERLTSASLEIKRKEIPELDLLLSMVTK